MSLLTHATFHGISMPLKKRSTYRIWTAAVREFMEEMKGRPRWKMMIIMKGWEMQLRLGALGNEMR